MASFKLRSGGNTLRLDTFGLANLERGPQLPDDFEIIGIQATNPFSMGGVGPQKMIADSSYDFDNTYMLDYTLGTDAAGNVIREKVNPFSFTLQFPIHKYSDVINMSLVVGPTNPVFQPYIPSGYDEKPWAANLHPFYNYLIVPNDTTPLPWFDLSTPIVLPAVDNWSTGGGGEDILETTLPINKYNYVFPSSNPDRRCYYNNANATGNLVCRFTGQATSIGGHAIAAGTNPSGTYDDPQNSDPGAYFRIIAALDPEPCSRWEVEFFRGGPADFPVGQRLRTMIPTPLSIIENSVMSVVNYVHDIYNLGFLNVKMQAPTTSIHSPFGYAPSTDMFNESNPPLEPFKYIAAADQTGAAGTVAEWLPYIARYGSEYKILGSITLKKA